MYKMNYSGDVYIFDFDDTLMWSTDWFADASIDSNGCVINPGKSPSLEAALDLIREIGSLENIPERFKKIRLRVMSKSQLNRRDLFFMALDSNNSPILIEDLEEFIPSKRLSESSIVGYSHYSLYASVIEDVEYYKKLDTVGDLGINEKIMNIYSSKKGEGVVLTARIAVSGMSKKISNVLEDASGYKPRFVYAQPLDCDNSGLFKAEVLLDIASRESVNNIYFYEDNPEYIKTILNFLFSTGRESEQMSIIVDKINIYPVSVKEKPDVNFKVKGDI